MKLINYFSIIAVPFVIFFILLYGLLEKVKVFDSFIVGAKEGIKTVINIFPTLVALFLSISAMQCSGILDLITYIFSPILSIFHFPVELLPLALIRPISGSASTAICTNIMKEYGVDTFIGRTASVIMGSTETTLYIIAIYTSAVSVKKIRFVLISSIIADVVGIAVAVVFCRILS